MFEYIKRVSIAISFITQKVDDKQIKLKEILNNLSFELLLIAQNFRTEEAKVEDLKNLEAKILLLIDVVDFARINNFISVMNAKVFTESILSFFKHILNLIEQKNNLNLPIYHLQEFDDVLNRKTAKENLQNIHNSEFTSIANLKKTSTESPSTAPTFSKITEAEAPKKILEESMIVPIQNDWATSPESIEKEIAGRRERILKALLSGGGSIKEISYKLKDINEKTIQRDLLELMRDKKVIMLGKKRWAKYYLK